MLSQFNTSLFIGVFLVATLLQADMEEAKEMFDEAECMRCHTPSHFKHRDDKVNSYKKLSNSVKSCARNSNAEWFDEDADMVTNYLNYKHYHYKVPPQSEED